MTAISAVAREEMAQNAASGVALLVVDDNASKRLALRAVLAPLGYSIVEAESGEVALRCVTAQDFAVILLDVRMPIMDGFETAALIRLRRQSETTPIIFVTGYASDELKTPDRYAGGAVDFMCAPLEPAELRAKIAVFVKLFVKAGALAAKAREVENTADQLRVLTDAAPIGIFQTDAENRYVYTNPYWTEITQLPAEAALGRAWDSIIDAEQRAAMGAHASDGATAQGHVSHRFELRHPGAPPQVVLVTSRPMLGDGGEVTGWVGTLADITAEAGAEAAMAQARDQADESSQLKSDFLANMSHEIRTPMNGVLGMTDLLLETDLDARQRDFAMTVRNSGQALLTIIDDILDFSKVEAGRLEVEEIAFDPRATVYGVVDLLAGPAQAKGLEIGARVTASVPAVVSGDPGRIRQVLTNLLGNAIKFTHAGEVMVRVTGTDVDDAGTVLRFEISDTGDGIAPEKLATVFQPFVQADTSTSRKYGGTGLGLAISSQLVALMGGECGVASDLGKGSHFWFTVRVGAHAGQSPQLGPEGNESLAGVSVLVVDDNASQRGILAEHLGDLRMAVTTAGGSPAALAALRTAAAAGSPIAVALVDRAMPGMDGLELNDAIAADPELTTRVVLLTGLGKDRDLEGATTGFGVSARLSKPVHRQELWACLRTVLGLSPDSADGPPQQRPGRSRRRDLGEAGRLLLAEDNLINQKVAVAMLADAGYRVEAVLNGAAAVQAVAAKPYDAILMDCQMPEMNGYEATAAIRAYEGSGRHTPIIAMTAGARREDRDRCLAEGMDSYLAKPFSRDALLAVVARSLSDRPADLAHSPDR